MGRGRNAKNSRADVSTIQQGVQVTVEVLRKSPHLVEKK